MFLFPCPVCWIDPTACLGLLKAEVSQVDFATDIRPIFKEHCYRCHGSTQQKAGLRLNLGGSEAPFEGDTGAVASGDADASLLVSLIRGEHEDIAAMPYKAESLPNLKLSRSPAGLTKEL